MLTADIVLSMSRRKRKINETPKKYVQIMRNLGDQANLEERDIICFIAEGHIDDKQGIRERLISADSERRFRSGKNLKHSEAPKGAVRALRSRRRSPM